jgi:hypothetical protein
VNHTNTNSYPFGIGVMTPYHPRWRDFREQLEGLANAEGRRDA